MKTIIKIKNKKKRTTEKDSRKKDTFWESKCNQICTYIGGSQSTETWKIIKNMKTGTTDVSLTLININKWKEYYESL